MKILVAITDEHPLIIKGLQHIFQTVDDLELLSAFGSIPELLKGLQNVQPDVLLMGMHKPPV